MLSRRPKEVLAVARIVLATWLLCGATAAAAEGPAALTNDDVMKLTAAGLGSDLIIAKINEAAMTDFALETDDLIALKDAGVEETVIEAMLQRRSGLPALPGAGAAAPSAAPTMGGSIATPLGTMVVGGGRTQAWLATADGNLPLTGILGETSMAWAYVTTFTFLNFAGLEASVRAPDGSPDLIVASEGSPTGRFYIAKLERDDDDSVRSLKMGRGNPFSPQLSMTPDPDWLIPFDAIDEGRGYWRLRPKKPFAPGEYGILVRGSQELFDFGIDGTAAKAQEGAEPRWKVWRRRGSE